MSSMPKIRVLLVDDSRSVRAVLRRFFSRAPDIEVVGEAQDGEQAVATVLATEPHAVLMDLQMPVLDGYDAIERIMAERPTPIVVLSSRANRDQMGTAFEAIRRGALEVLPKPEDPDSWRQLAERLPETLRAVTAARLRPRRRRRPPAMAETGTEPAVPPPISPGELAPGPLRWVAIGASTGGPAAIREFLEEVPLRPPVSVLVVQHIAAGFELGFADWLGKELPLDVRLAQDGEVPPPGAVRLAPSGAHLLLAPSGELHLDSRTPARGGHRPSVDSLFLSCAASCPAQVAGILMTGMGADGAEGLAALRRAGGVTLVQDEASSVVFGMPRAGLEWGAAAVSLPPRDLARAVARIWQEGAR
jgi:two-component system chemotaxis response regulator CheB